MYLAFGFRRQEAHIYSAFGRRKEKNINAKILIFSLLDKYPGLTRIPTSTFERNGAILKDTQNRHQNVQSLIF